MQSYKANTHTPVIMQENATATYTLKNYCSVKRYIKILTFSLITVFYIFTAAPSAVAGPLYDNYQDLKNSYPQFFQRLLDTGQANDVQIRDWLFDMDNYLANRNYVINQSNIKDTMKNALLNTLLMPENRSVYNAVNTAYSQEIADYLNGKISGDLAGFFDVIKNVILNNIIIATPSPGNILNGSELVNVTLAGSLAGVKYHYTLDGSTPGTSSNLYNPGVPIEISLIEKQKVVKAIAEKNNTQSDVYTFIYPSSNSNLSDLTINGSSLDQKFASQRTSYSARVAYNVSFINIVPTLADTNASLEINGVSSNSGKLSGNIALTVGANTVIVAVYAQNNISTKTYTLNVTREERNVISGMVSFDGFMPDNLSGVSVVVTGEHNLIRSTTTDGNGFYSFTDMQPGTYTICFSAPNILNKKIANFTNQDGSVINVKINAGDVNSDNKVTLSDLVLLAKSYNKLKDQQDYNQNCDFNNDNIINLADLILMAKSYNMVGDSF